VKTAFDNLKNQNGSVLALVLMVMVTILIIGITAIHDTAIEGKISRNSTIRSISFYRAEAAAREAIQLLENSDTPLTDLIPGSGSAFAWIQDVGFDVQADAGASAINSGLVPNAQYLVVYDGFAEEGELGMEEDTHLYEYIIYGRGFYDVRDQSDCMLQVAYRRRF